MYVELCVCLKGQTHKLIVLSVLISLEKDSIRGIVIFLGSGLVEKNHKIN